MKKVLAIVLAFVSLFTATAFAEITKEYLESLSYEELQDLKILVDTVILENRPDDMEWYYILATRPPQNDISAFEMKATKAPTPAPTPAPTVVPAPTHKPLKQGDEGTDVLKMKMRLYELGYFTTNNLSEIYNGTTAERVELFQQVNGLPQTGRADSSTLALLYSSKAKETTKYKVTPQPYAEYQKFDFKTYSRHPENYKNQKFKLTGKVVQVLGNREDGYEIRLATKGSYDDIVYLFVVSDPGFAILEDDRLTVYALAYETITYKTVLGASITLPAFIADEVVLK